MSIEDFIKQRIAEERVAYPMHSRWDAALATFEAILKWHDNWPVLVETPIELTAMDDFDIHNVHYQMTQRIAFMTNAEYIKRFGTAPPSAPILKMIAMTWCTHRDWDNEWETL